MSRRFRKTLLALAVILVMAMVTSLVLFRGQPPPRSPLPSPNGYNDFIKASELVLSTDASFADLDHESLRALVSTNAEALRLLRTGLTRQCAFPMDMVLTNVILNDPPDLYLNGVPDMLRFIELFAAEGRLREMDNQPADAAKSYIDAIRFGNEMSRGGLLITRIRGIAFEGNGCHALALVVPKLKNEDSRIVVDDLEKIDDGRVKWQQVLLNEKSFMRYQLRHRFNPFLWIRALWQSRQNLVRAETQHKIITAHERLLSGELALRLYRSERGHPPARLDELMPGYLLRVPQDPFSGKPMVYRPQGTNWLFYSIGPDGVDDGGRPPGRGLPVKGDLLFDSTW
jgi:hypothetical protein